MNPFSMKTWSDESIHPDFTVKIFLDTNILAYLVDETFPALQNYLDLCKQMPFVDLVSSKFVVFEFIEIRKREHYLRKSVSSLKKNAKGEINFSSLLKYHKGYDGLVKFEDVIADIRKDIKSELEKILRDFGIQYEYSIIHDDQLPATFEICLTSKISNQDALVLVSSALPQPSTTSRNVQLLTNDKDFKDWYNEGSLDGVFTSNNINRPEVQAVKDLKSFSGTAVNLVVEQTEEVLKAHLIDFILNALKRNKNFIGETFMPKALPASIVCFKMNRSTQAFENAYITILSKNLDFIYTSKRPISQLWNNGVPVTKDFVSPGEGDRINMAFKLVTVNDENEQVDVEGLIIDALRSDGNLVFIHPDSI
jgi:predicted nucleic acid-binding protein